MRVSTLRRGSFVVSLGLVATLVLSATSCAQVLGINKDYKKGVSAPKYWTCPASFYDEVGQGIAEKDATCDCVCGEYDPDCDVASVTADHSGDTDKDTAGNVDNAQCRSCQPDDQDPPDGACSPDAPP
jgi:hypothetical protein